MMHPWPLFGVDIATPDLRLRPLREADAISLAARLPVDLDLNPGIPRFTFGTQRQVRAVVSLQGYWRAYGEWRVDAWCLPFGVWHRGRLIGSQTLEGDDFLEKRVVDSASFLLPEWRNRGLGLQMRRAVLALAFECLDAEWAISSAWSDNMASLAVSRKLGYEPNGISRHVDGDRIGTLTHVRLTRERWLALGEGEDVAIAGIEPCLPLFGLDEDGG